MSSWWGSWWWGEKREREDEQEDDESGEKRRSVDDRFVLTRGLGAGTFNCTFLLNNGREVLRVGFLPEVKGKVEDNKMVRRGLEIVHVFQSFGRLLGPSLLVEISHYRIITENELSEHVNGVLCKQIRESQAKYAKRTKLHKEFALQHLEYLSGGLFDNDTFKRLRMTGKDLCFSVFSLMWFFAAGQQYFSFHHHDLKSGNLMVRHTDTPQTYHFTVEDTARERRLHYQFESKFVPVVIDFDFATVSTSENDNDRNVGGTRYTCSPDAFVYLLAREHSMNVAYAAEVYDWWSIGICILEWLLPFKLWRLFNAYEKPFVDNALKRLPYKANPYNRELLGAFFRSCCFASLVHNQSIRPPSIVYYDQIAKTDAVWRGWDAVIQNDQDYKNVQSAIQRNVPPQLLDILRQLLAWDPTVRNANNNPMNLIITSEYFNGNQTAQEAELGVNAYSGTTKGILEDQQYVQDIQVTDHPFLAFRVCSECSLVAGTQQLYMCGCCAQVYCGEACQAKTHL
jgi:serine/threonine protein kinase